MTNLKDMDIVYVVKDAVYNEELRYSLRSVEKNFPHRKVWLYGGRPIGVHPDERVIVIQEGKRKWDRVRNMLYKIATNDDITEDFVLFNDDFFVMKPVIDLPIFADGTLEKLCARIELANGNRQTQYTHELKRTIQWLWDNKCDTMNFELHLPMMFNRGMLKDLIEKTPEQRGTRSLYGNVFFLEDGTVSHKDVKIYDSMTAPNEDCDFLSTDDESFRNGKVGEFIRGRFPDKSKFER